jgi:hypothetical protein
MQAFICITNTGDTALGANLNLYSNVDNFTGIIDTIPLTSLVAPNCPYLANVPDGATTLRLIDPTSGCCFSLPFGNGFNLCEICEPIGFSNATNPNPGSISVGQLTGGCDPNISNYYLEWYGPGTGSTNMIFTSGFGTNTYAGNYQWTHPLTGDSQIYLYAGQYRPKIREVELNNFIFSSDYGAYGDCFQDNPLVVLPYTISNGSAAPEPYQHCIEFNTESVFPSNNFNGTIELSANTKYVPYRFNSGPQADLLRIYFSGANYLTPILVESLILGSLVNSTPLTTEFNVNLPSFDYKTWGSPQTFTKVLCLTGLTRSANDVLLFDIDPQGTQSPTSFLFCFTQLQSFDCEMCALTAPYYKIQQSTVSAATGTCGSLTVQFNVSGCSTTVDQNEDLYKYIFSGSGSASVNDAYGSVQKTISINSQGNTTADKDVLYNILVTPTTAFCSQVMGPHRMTITNTVSSGVRTINIYANNNPSETGYKFAKLVYDTFYQNINEATSQGLYDVSFDPNQPVYWGYITLYLPPYLTINPGQIFSSCTVSDPFYYNPLTKPGDYQFTFASPTVTVTSATTLATISALNSPNGDYIVTIQGSIFLDNPQDTILQNTFPAGGCYNSFVSSENDSIWTSQVNAVNSSINMATYNTTVNTDGLFLVGTKFISTTNPWRWDVPTISSFGAILTASTSNILSMYQYENKTYPLTGTSGNYGVKFSESAITCPNITTYTFDENSGTTTLNNYVKYHYLYQARFKNNIQYEYELLATPISPNGQPNFNTIPTLIGSGTTNPTSSFTVIDNGYFI